MLSKLARFFFQGLLLVVPTATTVYVLFASFLWVDKLITIENIPGLGLLIILVSITTIGVMSSTFLVKPLISWGEGLLTKLPIVNIIYSSIKDLLEAFVGNKKKFNHPVVVTLDKAEQIRRFGFITLEDVSPLGLDKDTIAVYLPHSYNISGNLFFVPRENVQTLDLPAADVMKFIVSGGISMPESFKPSYKKKKKGVEELPKTQI
jgi:uncharacterized membrane protein